MARLDTNGTASADSYVDWTGCELVERVPGKVSGRPIVRGTRILADTIVQDAELGSPLEEIHENYPDSHLVCPLATCAARAVRVVLDHNLPHKLRTSLGALGKHEIATASYLGWGELKNGELLGMAEDNGIDIFVTGEAKPCLRAEPYGAAIGDCGSLSQQLAHHQELLARFLPRSIAPSQFVSCGRVRDIQSQEDHRRVSFARAGGTPVSAPAQRGPYPDTVPPSKG
jgi:hypothetical protein